MLVRHMLSLLVSSSSEYLKPDRRATDTEDALPNILEGMKLHNFMMDALSLSSAHQVTAAAGT